MILVSFRDETAILLVLKVSFRVSLNKMTSCFGGLIIDD